MSSYQQEVEAPAELKDGWSGRWYKEDNCYRLIAWRDFPEGRIQLNGWITRELVALFPAQVTEMLNYEASQLMGRWPTPKHQWDELMLGKKKHEEAEAE